VSLIAGGANVEVVLEWEAAAARYSGDTLVGRGLHLFTFHLNVSALRGIEGAFRGF
jgi:hypothetical protein